MDTMKKHFVYKTSTVKTAWELDVDGRNILYAGGMEEGSVFSLSLSLF